MCGGCLVVRGYVCCLQQGSRGCYVTIYTRTPNPVMTYCFRYANLHNKPICTFYSCLLLIIVNKHLSELLSDLMLFLIIHRLVTPDDYVPIGSCKAQDTSSIISTTRGVSNANVHHDRRASISATSLTASVVRFRGVSSKTHTLSSMRMPMPLKCAGHLSSFATYTPLLPSALNTSPVGRRASYGSMVMHCPLFKLPSRV